MYTGFTKTFGYLGIAAAFGVFWFGLTVWLMRNKLNLE